MTTIPPCCANATEPTHCGCYDETYVRSVARRFVQVIHAYLLGRSSFTVLQTAAVDYFRAIRDPRSERAWPELTLGGVPWTDGAPGVVAVGWCVNASEDEMVDLALRLTGPIVSTVRELPGGVRRIEETATFRLPVMRPRSSAA